MGKGENGNPYEILPLSLALVYADKTIDSLGGRNYLTVEGVWNAAGSSEDELKWYRQAIDNEHYALLRAQAARIQLLGDWENASAEGLWMLFARLDSQFTSDALVGAEQFGVGGHNGVRGYREREFLGDSGVTATLELRTPIFVGFFDRVLHWGDTFDSRFDRKTKRSGNGWDRIQLIGFFDCGWYELKESQAKKEDEDAFLASVGLGVRIAVDTDAQFRFDWGFPIRCKDDWETDEHTGAGHVSFQLQF